MFRMTHLREDFLVAFTAFIKTVAANHAAQC